jgi:heparinase II/III-like protein
MRRGTHEIRRRGAAFLRSPSIPYVEAGPPSGIYRPRAEWSNVSDERRSRIVSRGRRVVDGWHEAYGHDWRRLPRDQQSWSTHPNGYRFPSGDWWTIPHLPPQADIKDVWEPGRFLWAYDLIRAYAVTADMAFASAFHERFASWHDANPPFRGVHWSCGQETAIRALAILHAEDALPLPESGADAAARRIQNVLAWSGERIADAIGYGLSQRNNHGISEAAALVHLGLRLRGAHPDATQWLKNGLRDLHEQIRDQFAADGWYAQHSFTYQRVALEQALLAQRALAAAGDSLSPDTLGRLERSVDLLTAIVCADTGAVPNHGSNDGARIAPFSSAGYRDFRPLLTLASIVLGRPLPADLPVDSEVVAWIGGAVPAPADRRWDGVVTGASGWAVARVNSAMAFIRAGTYTHRPSHLDLLHVNVRFDDRDVVTDPGTYAYNAPRPWNNGLVSARVHNAPIVDDQEPAERGARFLWYSWPSAVLVRTEYRTERAVVVAEIPGRVRREVQVARDSVTVVDQLLDRSARTMQVSWLLHPGVRESVVEAEGAEVIDAREGSVDAWFSPTYGCRVPSRVVRIRRDLSRDGDTIRTVIRRPHD